MFRRVVLMITLIIASHVQGQTALTIDDFARKPRVSQVGLSTDGRYFSGIMYINGSQTLAIDEIGVEEQPFFISGSDWVIRWHHWMSPSDVLISVSLPSHIQGTPVMVTRLVHADVAKRKLRLLFQKEQARGFFQIQDSVPSFLPHKPNSFLISVGKTDAARPKVYETKLSSHRIGGKLVQKGRKSVRHWQADAMGNVRVASGFTTDQKEGLLEIKNAAGEWVDYTHLVDRGFEVEALPTWDLDLVIAHKPTTGNFRPLWLFNVATGEWIEELVAHVDSEVSNVWLSEDGSEIRAISFDNESLPPVIYDESFKRLIRALDKIYPDSTNGIAAISQNQSRAIMVSRSGEVPSHYFLYDREKNTMDFLQTSYPSLHERAPGVVHRVTYEARDGLEIPGYVTLPKGVSPDSAPQIPFVVHPHGGPHARDFERFDWLVQLMVAKGYGVLQMNFRGSTGNGIDFMRKGRNEWGQAMQDDVTDGTHWLVSQRLADPDKICIVGGSYGGYASAMGIAKEPDLYQCGVAFNGVFDIEALLKGLRRFIGGRFSTRFIGNLRQDRESLRENSPINLVEQIKAPLLIIHGEDDRVVRVRQSRRMARSMPQARYVELPEGDHYLSRPENRKTFASELSHFLETHLGKSDYTLL